MRKAVIVITVIAVLSIGVAAYAHMRDGGHGRGGRHMMEQGCDGPMMNSHSNALDQKLLDETSGLRKELHAKKFDYREALRLHETEKAEKLEKDIIALKDTLREKFGKATGPGCKCQCGQ